MPRLLPDDIAAGKKSAAQSVHGTKRRPSQPARHQRRSGHGETGRAEDPRGAATPRETEGCPGNSDRNTKEQLRNHPVVVVLPVTSNTQNYKNAVVENQRRPSCSSQHLSPGHRSNKTLQPGDSLYRCLATLADKL